MTKTMQEINKIFREFQKNEWLFPSTWANTNNVNENLSFRTYFNEGRDYFVVEINDGKQSYTITRRINGWEIEHELGKSVSCKMVLEKLNQIKSYFGATHNEQKKKRLVDIKNIKREIKELNKTLKTLQSKGK